MLKSLTICYLLLAITFTTGDEEPSAAPNDINVEPLGATLRVTWRAPPIENWHGKVSNWNCR